MYRIFLSRNKEKICVTPDDTRNRVNQNAKILTFKISDKLKQEIFGDNWSIPVKDLPSRYYNLPGVRDLLLKYKRDYIEKVKELSVPETHKNIDSDWDGYCDNCGTRLTDSGLCPVCDDGEEDY